MADDLSGAAAVLTWRNGVVLSREEKDALTPAQWSQYADDSLVRDLGEIDLMPEPMRSWAQAAVGRARTRIEQQIARQEHREAS